MRSGFCYYSFAVSRHDVMHILHSIFVTPSAGEPGQQGGAKGHPGGRHHIVHQRTVHSQLYEQRCSCPLAECRPNTSAGPQRVSRKYTYKYPVPVILRAGILLGDTTFLRAIV
jgi:hypothetical protein